MQTPKCFSRFFHSEGILIVGLIATLSSCEKSDVATMPIISPCERNTMYLYDNAWLWVQMDTAVYRDISIFHSDYVDRIIVFDRDTVSHTRVALAWVVDCESFIKADSEPGVHYEIRSVNDHRLVLAQYCGQEYCRDANFIKQ